MKEETKVQLKELGLTTLENITVETVDALFKLIEIVIADTDNKFDDMIVPALPTLKDKLLELIDGIDKTDE